MSNKAVIGGVGMIKFAKPGSHEPYEIMASKAIATALKDAGLNVSEINDVILVGGQSRMPLVQEKVQSFFGTARTFDFGKLLCFHIVWCLRAGPNEQNLK